MRGLTCTGVDLHWVGLRTIERIRFILRGAQVCLNAMKMEHVVVMGESGECIVK